MSQTPSTTLSPPMQLVPFRTIISQRLSVQRTTHLCGGGHCSIQWYLGLKLRLGAVCSRHPCNVWDWHSSTLGSHFCTKIMPCFGTKLGLGLRGAGLRQRHVMGIVTGTGGVVFLQVVNVAQLIKMRAEPADSRASEPWGSPDGPGSKYCMRPKAFVCNTSVSHAWAYTCHSKSRSAPQLQEVPLNTTMELKHEPKAAHVVIQFVLHTSLPHH